MSDAPTFDDRFLREVPGDASRAPGRRQVMGACWSLVDPTPVPGPVCLSWVPEVGELLGLAPSDELTRVLGGNGLLPGMRPYSACYGGHQFGNWAGQLGDGRAITLGELVAKDGARWEVQLKGAGPTPYSRTADGRAVLRSSLRELLCSEAMHHLGVPTTRALSLVTTGEGVVRDMLYDGRPEVEPGAITCRVAPTFLRFGSYQIHAARGDVDTLRTLVDHTLRAHFPELGAPGKPAYLAWVAEVSRRTAKLVTEWMRVGFVHGVLNTDNMSILGLTLDYGPYGFLDGFDPGFTPNTTDAGGKRYRYGAQPRVAFWNLAKLAEAILPLVDDDVPAVEKVLDAYGETFQPAQRAMWLAKLGLRPTDETARDDALLDALFDVLAQAETDMTIFFRRLADVGRDASPAPLFEALYAPDAFGAREEGLLRAWLARLVERRGEDGVSDAERRARMLATNPAYLPRNYLAQLAIDAATKGDGSVLAELLDVCRTPYDERPERARYFEKRPEWARHRVGCAMLSCSS